MLAEVSTDEPLPQVPVHNVHHGMHPDTVFHGENLDTAQLPAFEDFPLTIVRNIERTVRNLTGQVPYHLFPMRKEPAALAAPFPFHAAQDRIKGLGHVSVVHYLLYDISFPAHSFSNFGC